MKERSNAKTGTTKIVPQGPVSKLGSPSKDMNTKDMNVGLTDRELVFRAKSGDTMAFKQLVTTYHGRAYARAISILRNPDDAMDAVQEAFIKVHKSLPNFRGDSSFYTWLYRIVHNVSIDQSRKISKHKNHVEMEDATMNTVIDDTAVVGRLGSFDPSQALDRKQLGARIEAGLEQLSAIHRSVIIMREIEGLSYQEMATVMSCSEGTIMSRLFHARKKMQIALGGNAS